MCAASLQVAPHGECQAEAVARKGSRLAEAKGRLSCHPGRLVQQPSVTNSTPRACRHLRRRHRTCDVLDITRDEEVIGLNRERLRVWNIGSGTEELSHDRQSVVAAGPDPSTRGEGAARQAQSSSVRAVAATSAGIAPDDASVRIAAREA
jgi:hypothetical protein